MTRPSGRAPLGPKKRNAASRRSCRTRGACRTASDRMIPARVAAAAAPAQVPSAERIATRDSCVGEERRRRVGQTAQRVADLAVAHQEGEAREDRVRVGVVQREGGPVGAVRAVRLSLLLGAAPEVDGGAREVGETPHADLPRRALHALQGPGFGRGVVLRERRQKLEPLRPVEAAGDRRRQRREGVLRLRRPTPAAAGRRRRHAGAAARSTADGLVAPGAVPS